MLGFHLNKYIYIHIHIYIYDYICIFTPLFFLKRFVVICWGRIVWNSETVGNYSLQPLGAVSFNKQKLDDTIKKTMQKSGKYDEMMHCKYHRSNILETRFYLSFGEGVLSNKSNMKNMVWQICTSQSQELCFYVWSHRIPKLVGSTSFQKGTAICLYS